jgi:hypothetical protein
MNYNSNTVFEIIDPSTSKVVDALDMSRFKCYDGQCGGCVDCLLRQAIYYGYITVRIDRYEDESDFFKKEEFYV